MAHFENGVSVLGGSFFRTGCQFGVPGGTYLPKKNPSAPPRDFKLLMLSPVSGVQLQPLGDGEGGGLEKQ